MQDASLLSRRYTSELAYVRALQPPSLEPRLEDPPTGADWVLPVNVPSTADVPGQPQKEPSLPKKPFRGDWALANSNILIRDGIWFLEACLAVALGDIGRVWEVMKVRLHDLQRLGVRSDIQQTI